MSVSESSMQETERTTSLCAEDEVEAVVLGPVVMAMDTGRVGGGILIPARRRFSRASDCLRETKRELWMRVCTISVASEWSAWLST